MVWLLIAALILILVFIVGYLANVLKGKQRASQLEGYTRELEQALEARDRALASDAISKIHRFLDENAGGVPGDKVYAAMRLVRRIARQLGIELE